MHRFLLFPVLFLLSLSFIASSQAVELDLDEYRGKVVYLDFWASWCIPCRYAFPLMNALYDDYAEDGLVVIAVNLDENREDAEQFLKQIPASFRVVYDPDGELARKYDVRGVPSSYLFDRSGKLVKTHTGFKKKDAKGIRSYVESLLNQEAS